MSCFDPCKPLLVTVEIPKIKEALCSVQQIHIWWDAILPERNSENHKFLIAQSKSVN